MSRPSALLLGAAAAAVFASSSPPPARAAEDAAVRALLRRAVDDLEAWDIEGAAKDLDELSALVPDAPETLWLRGRVLFEQGSYGEAERAFAQAETAAGEASFPQERKLARAAEEEVRAAAVHQSAHFVLRTKAAKDGLLAPYALAALERAWAQLTRDLGYAPPGKVRVEVYDSAEALARVSPLSVAEIKASGTIALCKYNRLMITSPRALLRGYPWLDTLSHEFVHYLVTRKGRGKVPIWLQEGMAKFLETRWRGEPGGSVDEASLALLLRAARTRTLIPFAAMHPSIAKLPTQEKAALAFAEVEAAIRLLYQRHGQAGLTSLVAAMAEGVSDEEAVARAYGKGFAEFERDWRAAVSTPRPQAVALASGGQASRPAGPRKLIFREDARAAPERAAGGAGPDAARLQADPRARRAVRLGELMLARRRFGAAAAEYRRARELLPAEDPVVSRRYAFAELQLGHLAEAEEALRSAVQKDPQDEAAQVLLARTLLGRKANDDAGRALEAAVALDPFDPELHAVWVELARTQKDDALAAREQGALLACLGKGPADGSLPRSRDR